VDGVSFEVRRGRVFGLLGPNGAGKTTIIKMLTTLLPITSGSAVVAGCDVAREPSKVRRAIGYVPQMLSADGSLTARENLSFHAALYDVPRAQRRGRVSAALASVGLEDSGDRLVRQYSGGMIRRLEIAQAMLHAPQVLFLDEPTVGLDPVAREAVWDLLKDLGRKHNTTLVLTTHYMDEADELCDEILLLSKGKAAAAGTPDSLKAALGEGATLDDVFRRYSGGELEEGGDFRETRRRRRNLRRLG
jgi:ABC-2 type transport system ATP-binding protein